MIPLRNVLANWCERLSDWLSDHARRLRRCPQCGRNPYTSPPCL